MSDAVLTVLGSSGTYPSGGRVCVSYLLESGGSRLLLDCGNGSLSNLTRITDLVELDAVLISHLHPDHFADLYGMLYALRFHPTGPRKLDVHAPRGARERIGRLLDGPEDLDPYLRFHEIAAGDRLDVGSLDIELFPAAHPVEAVATRVRAGDRVVAYSGDSGPSDHIVEAARDADLFVCDSTWLEARGPHPADVHMTGAQAGDQARRAGARRLLVTHVFPTNDRDAVAAEARERFDGDVLVAEDMGVLRL